MIVMGKNTKGGNKQKSQKNGGQAPVIKLDEIQPNNVDVFVGLVTKSCGSKRFIALLLNDNIEISVKLAGSVRARIALQDYVMVQKAENLGGCNAYILHKYSEAEIKALGIKKIVQAIDGTIDTEVNDDIGFSFDDI